jgi:hypothetical protein
MDKDTAFLKNLAVGNFNLAKVVFQTQRSQILGTAHR